MYFRVSRTSALTTFRLIGSPTNPDWPYCRPWLACCAMLSFNGVPPRFTGVGEGSAIGRADDSREFFFATAFADAPPANANVLSERPKAHASAQVLTATFLKCLGIIPSRD